MYFLGQVAATAPGINAFLGDIIGMLNGTITSTAGLTAGNFQGTPKLVTTVAPGWATTDAAAGTVAFTHTPVVIRSPYSDDGTKYKNIYVSALSATSIGLRGYETWNSSTHVGTNPHVLPVVSGKASCDLGAGYWLVISASASHLFVAVYPNSTFGNSPQTYFVTEYGRDDPWNTVANGYPSWISTGSYGAPTVSTAFMSHSRFYNTNTAADVVSITWGSASGSNPAKIVPYCSAYGGDILNAGLEFACVAGTNPGSSNNGADSAKVTGYTLNPFRLQSWNPVTYGVQFWGSITAKAPYLFGFRGVWASGDEVDVGATRYLICNLGGVASTSMAIKQV